MAPLNLTHSRFIQLSLHIFASPETPSYAEPSSDSNPKRHIESAMATYLITGTSRGVGLELTKQLLDLPTSEVSKIFAVTRSPPAGALLDLINKNQDRVVSIIAAVDNSEGVKNAASEVAGGLGSQGLDVLVNNAAITSFSPGGCKTMPLEQLADVFNVNVLGPQRMIAAFLPLLEKGSLKKVVNL